MLYEKHNIRGKVRKDRGGKVQLHINLGVKSEFERDTEVIIMHVDDFKKLKEQNQNSTSNQSEISELEEKITQLDSEKTKLEEELEKTNPPQLQEEISKLTTENNKLKDEIDDSDKLKELITQLETENSTLKQENTDLKKETNESNSQDIETINQLQNENKLLTERNNDLTTRNSELTSQNQELKQDIKDIDQIQLEKTITQLETENKNLHEKINDIPRIMDLEEQHQIEIRYLSSQLNDEKNKVLRLMRGIIDTYNRGAISRVRNTIPETLESAMDIDYLTGEKKLVLDGQVLNDKKDSDDKK